jgi:hypothetical protein
MTDQQTTITFSVSRHLRHAVYAVMQLVGSVDHPVVIAAANDNATEQGAVAQVVREFLTETPSSTLSFRAKSRNLPPQRFSESQRTDAVGTTPPLRSGRSLDKLGGDVTDNFGAQVNVQIVTPPALASLTWQRIRHRREPSVEVDLRGRGGQLESVRIAKAVATARSLIAVNDLRGESNSRPTIAIGVWGRFTDVRDRLGLGLSAGDKGAAAEIALAVRPDLIVLVDRWQGYLVAMATTDQIAAELAGLALRQIIKGDAEEPIGPWEDPLVQRSTELRLGVLLPDQIAIRGLVGSEADAPSRESVALLADEIALKLGVEKVSVVDRAV